MSLVFDLPSTISTEEAQPGDVVVLRQGYETWIAVCVVEQSQQAFLVLANDASNGIPLPFVVYAHAVSEVVGRLEGAAFFKPKTEAGLTLGQPERYAPGWLIRGRDGGVYMQAADRRHTSACYSLCGSPELRSFPHRALYYPAWELWWEPERPKAAAVLVAEWSP